MSLFTLYLISILPNLSILFIGLAIISIGILLLTTIIYACHYDSQYTKEEKTSAKISLQNWLKSLKYYVSCVVIISLLACLVPNEKQIYMIVGGYSITNIEGIDKLPANLVNVANSYLEKIKETNNISIIDKK